MNTPADSPLRTEPAPRPDSGTVPPSRRNAVVAGLLVALVFLAVWLPLHPSRPLLPTTDLYTNLTVTRHLARGEGFLTDVAYPVSFAFPFARRLPQPILQMQPGFPLLLTVPWLTAGREPATVIDHVRVLQSILLGATIWLGAIGLLRRKAAAGLGAWLVLGLLNPLLAFAVDWGYVELITGLVLLAMWLRGRAGMVPGAIDGLLAGLLTALRLDLFWLPVLWWLARPDGGGEPVARSRSPRRPVAALLVWAVLILPWAVRNTNVTGQPFFTLQAYAEHVKMSRGRPDYEIYRGLDPQPFLRTMITDPVPVLRKTARGVKFFFREMPGLLPGVFAPFVGLGAILFLLRLGPRVRAALSRRRTGRDPPAAGPGTGPFALAAFSLLLLVLEYSAFDHSLRHLLVLLPVLLWEFSVRLGTGAVALVTRSARVTGQKRRPAAAFVLTGLVAGLVILIFPSRPTGWEQAAREAEQLGPATARQVDAVGASPAEWIFTEYSAVPWFADRPAVWSPLNDEVRRRIRTMLESE